VATLNIKGVKYVSVWSIAFTLFIVANPIGNIPPILAVIKDFEFKRQKLILFRESIFSYLFAIVFLFIGEEFLQLIQIKQYSVSISGGILLFLVALNMIFPPKFSKEKEGLQHEPFLVPIATPLITGGGALSTIMIYAAQEQSYTKMALAITIAWTFVVLVVTLSAYLLKLLGQRGLIALEQLMGMILSMIAMQIIVNGLKLFTEALSV
jgi:multiple antibiotic resistance protein